MPQKIERRYLIRTLTGRLFRKLKEAGRDLLPIILVIVVFQLAILRQPFPELLGRDLGDVLEFDEIL